MEATCAHCGNTFEAERSTAKFCSATCRVNAARAISDAETVEILENSFSVTAVPVSSDVVVTPSVTLKRECKRDENCCTECVDFESGVHWCPNKECGCWESPEEQRAYLERFQTSCPHPESEAYMSRCLKCGRVAFTHEEKESDYKSNKKRK